MSYSQAILDTDILSEVLKQKNATVVAHAANYLYQHGCFVISAISRYEILRGYLATNATTARTRFEGFCQNSLVLPLTDAILDRASEIWAMGYTGGHPLGDADILIAATAIEHQRLLVTGNSRHYAWIPGLTIADWRQP